MHARGVGGEKEECKRKYEGHHFFPLLSLGLSMADDVKQSAVAAACSEEADEQIRFLRQLCF
jgi:hypothetical protein